MIIKNNFSYHQKKIEILSFILNIPAIISKTTKKGVAEQTRRHGGAYRGRAPPTDCLCPPKQKLCPPKRGLCPEEIKSLGVFGAQIEVQISVFLWTDTRFCDVFGKTFFLEITCFRPEKPLEFPISAGKSL